MRTRRTEWIFALVVLLGFFTSFWVRPIETVWGHAEEPIRFADHVFERLLQAELGLEEIRPSDLLGFTGMQVCADQFVFLEGNGRTSQRIVLYGDDTFEYDRHRYTGFGSIKTLRIDPFQRSCIALRLVSTYPTSFSYFKTGKGVLKTELNTSSHRAFLATGWRLSF